MKFDSVSFLLRTSVAMLTTVGINAFAEDGGPATAVAAQEGGPAAVAVPVNGTFISATEKVQETLEKLGVFQGYNEEKQTIIVVGSALLAEPNPAGDDKFMIKRSVKAMEAYLNAKAEIIRSFSMNFSSSDQIATAAEFGDSEEKVAMAQKINAFKDKIAEFGQKTSHPELVDAPVNDGLGEAIANAAKANPETPEAGDFSEEGKALQDELKTLLAEVDAIEKTPVNESTSTVSLMAKMPLLGATVITQAESWDATEKRYEIAMAVLWSPKLQENAKKLACGTAEPAEKKGTLTAQEWIAKQDLAAMVGPRRFTDKNGNCVVIGISARDISGIPTVKIKPAKQLADTDAIKYVATSLACDLAAFREASQNLKEYEDDTSSASEKITDKVMASTDLQLSGVLPLKTKEALHPISGRKTYFVAYYLNPVLNAKAMDYIKKLYADSITVTKATQYKRGQLAGMEEAREAAKKDTEAFDKGKRDAGAEVQGMVRAEEVKAKIEGAQGSDGKTNVGAHGGAVSGDNLDTVEIE